MLFLNHNSFVILGLFIWVVALIALRQRGWKKGSWLVMVGLTAVLAVGYFSLRPTQATSDRAEEIRAQIGQGTPVLLEFQSKNWLGCVMAEPVVNGLQAELAGKLTVLRVDISSSAGREMTAQTGSRATPTFIFYDSSGTEQWRQIGSLDAEKVRASVP